MMETFRDLSLVKYNTFGLNYKADRVIHLHSEDEAREFLKKGLPTEMPVLILGAGSNILFTSDFKGTILHPCLKGISVSEKRSRRIMREENLVAKAARRFKRTTNSKHNHKKAPDLVRRDFSSSKPHSLWTSDFTAIWTREGWLYLVVFLDVCTRMVVGWAACATMAETTLIKAFNDALTKRIPLPSAIIHSDQGGQYFGKLFQSILNLYHIQQSMGATGICFDNAITESLWNSLKTECFLDVIPETRREAELMIFETSTFTIFRRNFFFSNFPKSSKELTKIIILLPDVMLSSIISFWF